MCDLIPKRSATSDISDLIKAHLHPNTQEQHSAIRVCPVNIVLWGEDLQHRASNAALAAPMAKGKGSVAPGVICILRHT